MARPAFRAAPVRVRVPASSANLGPGFDALGLALGRYDDVVVRVADSGLAVDVAGECADDVPRDERHLVVRALTATFDRLGGRPRGLEVVCANRIPHGRGLGSSAAAIAAGVVAARALTLGGERLGDDEALAVATDLEGHPDNVAAALFGGLTLAWVEPAGVRHVRLPVDPRLAPVAFVPTVRCSTAHARRLLPEQVPHADAAANAGRAGLLVEALGRRPDLLLAATEDRLHQAYRSEAMPESAALIAALRGAGVPAVLSGAGPTVLALTTAGTRADAARRAGTGWTAVELAVDTDGARVVPLDAADLSGAALG